MKNNSSSHHRAINTLLPIETFDKCERDDCSEYVAHIVVQLVLERRDNGIIIDHKMTVHHVCENHYIPLAVDIAGQATNGQIFG
jgi:hypothetical protein